MVVVSQRAPRGAVLPAFSLGGVWGRIGAAGFSLQRLCVAKFLCSEAVEKVGEPLL